MPHIVIDESRCKGCALCTTVCPRGLVVMSQTPGSQGNLVARFGPAEKCIGCAMCAQMCPDSAITVFR